MPDNEESDNWPSVTSLALLAIAACLLAGLAGGLIGYGEHGTIEAACKGAGWGIAAIPLLMLFLLFLAAMG